jgi:hypothetical protein
MIGLEIGPDPRGSPARIHLSKIVHPEWPKLTSPIVYSKICKSKWLEVNMETSSVLEALHAPPLSAPAHELSANELKLIQWAIGRKAYSSRVAKVIENFIRQKDGATLDVLTNNELNALKIQATSLGVSIAH